MKILYLHQYFNTPEMPGGTRSYEMARRLVAAGHEVHMVTTWREVTDKRDWFTEQIDGIRVHWLPQPYSNSMGYWTRLYAFFRFALKAAGRAARIGGDLVFATSTPLTIAIPGVWAARRLKVPMVFEVRDLWPEMPIAIGALRNPLAQQAARWLERFAYRNSAHVVALSEEMGRGVAKTGYPDERITIIPNSADLQLFGQGADAKVFRASIDGLDDGPLILYAGTLGPVNGVGYLVDIAAAAATLAPELRFAVVGDGKEAPLVRHRALQAGVLGRTFFMLPPMPKERMPQVLAGADVALSLFVDLEPMWANSANKFFDALAAGKPVAINYGGWQARALAESGAGIRLPANDAVEAARMLSRWVSDRQALVRAGEAARRLAQERYDRDKLALALEQVMVSVVQTHATPGHTLQSS